MAYDATDFIAIEVPAPETQERTNMRRLSEFLRREPEKFSYMNARDASCNTPACILGWARARSGFDDSQRVYQWLGLTPTDGHTLCFRACYGAKKRHYQITGTDAANVLDHYLATGNVDWSVAR